MKVLPISAFYDNYIWVIIDEDNKTAFCIDPGEAAPVLAFIKQEALKLEAILLTHHHNDHIGGVTELTKINPEIAVYGPRDQRIPQVNRPIQDGDIVSLPPCQFHVLGTPGHTTTHISFYEPRYGWLFCGDTLFSAGCGRIFDGSAEALHRSLKRLSDLPNNTQVFCAHEYTRQNLRFAATIEPDNPVINDYATQLMKTKNKCSLPSNIALEKQINPFFRTDTQGIQAYAKLKGCKQTDSLSIFKQIRADKDNFS